MEVVVILKGIKCLAFTATLHEVTIMQDDVIFYYSQNLSGLCLYKLGLF